MIEVAGKRIFTELPEIIQPEHTALLVIDMQQDFCSEKGLFHHLGVDLSMYSSVIQQIAKLLESARAAGVRPVFVQMTTLPNLASDSPAQIHFNLRLHKSFNKAHEPLNYAVDGSEGQRFVPELQPQENELIVRKYRSSAFWGTNLDLVLRSNGMQSVVVTGCTTEGCVESTARDAMFNDYYVVLATDAVGSDDRKQHEASMFLMAHRFELATSEEIQKAWSMSETK